MPESRLLGAALRWVLEAGLGYLWLFTSYRVWANPSSLTPRNLPVPISSDFVAGHSGHSDKWGGPQGAGGTRIHVMLLHIRER